MKTLLVCVANRSGLIPGIHVVSLLLGAAARSALQGKRFAGG